MKLVHVTNNLWQIGQMVPSTVGLSGSPKERFEPVMHLTDDDVKALIDSFKESADELSKLMAPPETQDAPPTNPPPGGTTPEPATQTPPETPAEPREPAEPPSSASV